MLINMTVVIVSITNKSIFVIFLYKNLKISSINFKKKKKILFILFNSFKRLLFKFILILLIYSQ